MLDQCTSATERGIATAVWSNNQTGPGTKESQQAIVDGKAQNEDQTAGPTIGAATRATTSAELLLHLAQRIHLGL